MDCFGSLTRMPPQTPDSSLPSGTDTQGPAPQSAWGHGLATVADDGTVLDTWFPAPALGEPSGEPAPEALTALARTFPQRRVRTEVVTVAIDLAEAPQDASDAYLRLHLLSHRLVRPHGANVDGHLRHARQRRLDQRRSLRRHRVRGGPARAPRRRPGAGLRGRQVPPDDRLRAPHRRPHRRCRPRASRRPPGRGHHRDARGLLQLQRRHARRLDGRGADQRRRRGRGRVRHRRRRLDHGHPLRWREGGHLDRRALPAGRQRRHRHLPGGRLRRRGRAATSPPAPR